MAKVLAAPISDELAERAHRFVSRVRSSASPRECRQEAISLINDLTRAGLEGYFLASTREIGLGRLVEGAVSVALATSSRAISALVGRFVGRFDDEQMAKTADILERVVMDRPAADPRAC